MLTRPQPHEAEAEAEATAHEAEAEATTHEAEAEAEATTHEAEAEAKTHLEIPIIFFYLSNILTTKKVQVKNSAIIYKHIINNQKCRPVACGGARGAGPTLRFAWPHLLFACGGLSSTLGPPMDRAGPCCKTVTLRGCKNETISTSFTVTCTARL